MQRIASLPFRLGLRTSTLAIACSPAAPPPVPRSSGYPAPRSLHRVSALLALSCAWVVCAPSAAQIAPLQAAESNPGVQRLTFGWNASVGCPTRESVLARAERLLGRAIELALASPIVVEATVRELGTERWELRFTAGDPGAQARVVTAASCDELADVAALFIALSVNPALAFESIVSFTDENTVEQPRTDRAAPRAETPAASPAPPPTPPAERATPPTGKETHAAHSVRPLVAATAALGLGRLPGVAIGGVLEGGIAIERLSLRAQVGYFPPQHAAVTDSAGGDVSLVSAGARGVYGLLGRGAPILGLSAGMSFGWLHGTGTGVANKESGDALVIGVEPGVRAGYALTASFALVADATLVLSLNRPRFVLEDLGEVFQPPRFAAQFGLGAEWSPP